MNDNFAGRLLRSKISRLVYNSQFITRASRKISHYNTSDNGKKRLSVKSKKRSAAKQAGSLMHAKITRGRKEKKERGEGGEAP
ncbi:hypothetical protein EAI_14042 [Harpegnathos saltator]|uniref:60S ribosomal protein L28 n=1 Tax=Harpegnathos saltator TaxID=610380 RepID=E2BYR3_HARSA|nr:hypothetical protein EAI_14042 [Harpegnathos saltator]